MKTKFSHFAFFMGLVFVFPLNIFSQESSVTDFQNSQEIYKRIIIQNINDSKTHQLHELGIDLTCGAVFKDQKLTVELHESQLNLLNDQNIDYDVLIDDMQKFYSDRAINDLPNAKSKLQQEKALASQKSFSINEVLNNVGQHDDCDEIDWSVPFNWNLNPNNSPNSFGGCLTYDQVLQELDDMRSLYPNLISVKTNASPINQLTVEGRTVYYVRISDNPDVDEAGEPETLYQSLIHSREASSLMQLLYYMWYVLENYDSDSAIKNLVDNQALYFIPVFNPDGFVYNQTVAPDGGGNQRKNRNTSAPGSCSTFLDGVDLNRNSAYYWGNGGASTNSCSDTYLGTAPFSENETQIMRDFFLDHDFELALNHHSFKNAMLHAYAGTNITNPRPDEYSKYNHDMTFYNRYAHGPSTSISALNSGNMNDWMLGGPAGVSANGTPTGTGSGKNTMAWTPENGSSGEGGFWPAPSNFLPIAKRAMRMNFMAAYFSGKYAKLHDLNQSDITTTSGNLQFGIERLGQTDGDFTLTVTPISSNIISIGSASTQTGMSVLQQNNINISYTLDPSIQANDEIEFKVVLTNDYASGNVLYEANIVKTYNPNISFIDNPDTDGISNWSTSGGSWSVTSDAFTGNSAITSTLSAPYSNNESKQIQMNGSIDLSNSETTLIQFYAKWDLERSFDYVQIEGSINGTNWTPLCGKLTKPGAPNANNSYSGKGGVGSANNNFQPDEQALYDGDTQDKWNMEEIVIDASNNSFLFNENTVFLRFNFKTEGSNRKDSYANVDFEGFTFDDFKVITLLEPCSASVPNNLLVNSITSSSADINWDAILGTDYDLRYRIVGSSTWIDVNDIASNTFSLSGLTELTDYEVQVRSKCPDNSTSDYTNSVVFTTLDIQLNYCNSGSTNVNDEFISNVQINTIDNDSGAQFYSDFTSISTTLTKGSEYSISITPIWTGTVYNEAYSVWIDYNKDGDFEDSGEQVWTQSPTQQTPVTGSFTIPSSAIESVTRMRVSMMYNDIPESCETFTWGEVEDYTVIIEPDAPDTTIPVITLVGNTVINIDVGGVYSEQGATATDNIDGDISGNIVIGGDIVNTSLAGTYFVTYNVSDAAGNPATEVTRTVNVNPDTTIPVITLIGGSVLGLDVGGFYTEQGATATDNVDGDITSSIITGGDLVNPLVAGEYVVTYNVSDAAGNPATEVTRTVFVIPDTTGPVISLIGNSIINLNVGGFYNELGATASDNIDGDISGNIVIGGDIVNTSLAGTYFVTYNVSDAAGNPATEVIRTINVNEIASGCTVGINTFPYTEGFENTFGAWTQSTTDDINWSLNSGTTPSVGTGPSNAIEGNNYIYVEASGNGTGFPNKQAILNSPCFDLSGLTEATFSFNYHMFGSTDMGIINLEITTDEGLTWSSIWSETGNKGNSWQIVNINISTYVGSGMQMRFNRITGGIWQADIAIDNLSLIEGVPTIQPCSGGITSYPYNEGFEGSIGAWTQSSNDDLNWIVDANGTTSNGTGPSSAIDGNFYIYVEASGNGSGFPSKQAIITSPCFDLTNQSSATFDFNYHMFGSNNAGTIDLEVSIDDGDSWETIWTETGNNGDSWFNKQIDLNSYLGESIQLRFNRVTGTTWQADVAIDGISLNTVPTTTFNQQVIDKNLLYSKVGLFPNPVKRKLNITLLNIKPERYEIVNAIGQIVLKGTYTKTVDVSKLENGTYVLKLYTKQTIETKRFIKN